MACANGYYWIHLYGYWRIARFTAARPNEEHLDTWEVFTQGRVPYVLTDLTGVTIGERIELPDGGKGGDLWG